MQLIPRNVHIAKVLNNKLRYVMQGFISAPDPCMLGTDALQISIVVTYVRYVHIITLVT